MADRKRLIEELRESDVPPGTKGPPPAAAGHLATGCDEQQAKRTKHFHADVQAQCEETGTGALAGRLGPSGERGAGARARLRVGCASRKVALMRSS